MAWCGTVSVYVNAAGRSHAANTCRMQRINVYVTWYHEHHEAMMDTYLPEE